MSRRFPGAARRVLPGRDSASVRISGFWGRVGTLNLKTPKPRQGGFDGGKRSLDGLFVQWDNKSSPPEDGGATREKILSAHTQE